MFFLWHPNKVRSGVLRLAYGRSFRLPNVPFATAPCPCPKNLRVCFFSLSFCDKTIPVCVIEIFHREL